MTASAGAASRPVGADGVRRIPLAPAEGWVTVGLVALMAFTIAWAIDDVGYVIGNSELTNFLPWAAFGGVAAGFLGAKVGWRRWMAHLAGAVAAALILPLIVGTVLLGDAASLGELYRVTAASVAQAFQDIVVLNRPLTRAIGHHLLAFGILCWGTGQYAAYTVFGHRRPLDAVVVVGLVLLGNMAVTRLDQLGQLIIFSMAALFLLTRTHAFEEQTAWIRRRIGDPSAVRSLYLRGGTTFVVAAVVGSLVLTASASSAPLQGAWADLPNRLVDLSRHLQRILPAGGQTRPVGVGFGSQVAITGSWTPSTAHALTITLPETEQRRFYWRAVAYDKFDLNGWSWSEPTAYVPRGPDEALLGGLSDDPGAEGRRPITFSVDEAEYYSDLIVSPQTPVAIDRDSTLVALGEAGYFGGVEVRGTQYTVTALVPAEGDEQPRALTANKLRVAGRNYPISVTAQYLDVPAEAVDDPSVAQLVAEILPLVPDNNPYDVAVTIRDYLRTFDYSTNVTDLPCQDLSVVECFARYRRGYCEYYASTMVILLRQQGIPARLAEGFLPGERSADGVEAILQSNAHAWVEAYFPDYGWVTFDPTGGPIRPADALPSGEPQSPRPSASLLVPTRGPEISGQDINPGDRTLAPADGGAVGGGGSSQGPFVVIGILLAIVVGALAFVAWQRGPRDSQPDDVWRGVARLAARFGFGPRPTETVYEYAGSLGQVIPSVRPELETVARAKVEVAYGRRLLSEDRLRRVREAQRRLRVSLLRLAFRRGRRRR